MLNMVRECGWAGWVVILGSMVAMGIAFGAVILALTRSKAGRPMAALTLAAALAVGGLGAFGTMTGRNATDKALAGVVIDPARVGELRATGYAEAQQCTNLALGGMALPVLLGLIALGATFALTPKRD
jgi:hypothetical protein